MTKAEWYLRAKLKNWGPKATRQKRAVNPDSRDALWQNFYPRPEEPPSPGTGSRPDPQRERPKTAKQSGEARTGQRPNLGPREGGGTHGPPRVLRTCGAVHGG